MTEKSSAESRKPQKEPLLSIAECCLDKYVWVREGTARSHKISVCIWALILTASAVAKLQKRRLAVKRGVEGGELRCSSCP